MVSDADPQGSWGKLNLSVEVYPSLRLILVLPLPSVEWVRWCVSGDWRGSDWDLSGQGTGLCWRTGAVLLWSRTLVGTSQGGLVKNLSHEEPEHGSPTLDGFWAGGGLWCFTALHMLFFQEFMNGKVWSDSKQGLNNAILWQGHVCLQGLVKLCRVFCSKHCQWMFSF